MPKTDLMEIYLDFQAWGIQDQFLGLGSIGSVPIKMLIELHKRGYENHKRYLNKANYTSAQLAHVVFTFASSFGGKKQSRKVSMHDFLPYAEQFKADTGQLKQSLSPKTKTILQELKKKKILTNKQITFLGLLGI
jgi:hypothetical protein